MATDWTELINQARMADPVLSGLSSTSKTAEYRLWQAVIGAVMGDFEQIVAADRADIEAIVEANRGVGTARWYERRALEFQWSDKVRYSIAVNEDGYARYPQVVEADRIVKQAAAVVSGDKKLLLKVATTDADGILCPLSDVQFTDFRAYVTAIALPGQEVEHVNKAADELTVTADVYYSVGTTSTGIHDELMAALQALTLATGFNGRVYRSAVADALQSVSGVVDVDIKGLSLTDADGRTSEIERVATATAGYFNISPRTSLTLKTE